ncbi:hypothetical protein SNE40_017868 [Patella caerulea]|uniref:VOC domain-containing protein n=1 Tax=Patella caerulea TaxID=87958 RepID=A0AAN8PEV8_PATCE
MESAAHRCALHHLEMRVSDGEKMVTEFVMKYGFRVIGERDNDISHQWSLKSRECNFIVTEIKPIEFSDSNRRKLAADPYVTGVTANDGWVDDSGSADTFQTRISTVSNVALEVNNLEKYLEKLEKCGVIMIKPIQKVSNQNGEILIATVKSCLENIVHSLVQRNNFKGQLLPGFNDPSPFSISLNSSIKSNIDITHVDHVTFVCETGRSPSVLAWYEKCFGMMPFSLNRDDPDGSLVVKGPNVGLRLSAFDYWKCSETGLTFPGKNKLTFVIAEPFGNSGHSHVKTFMKQHNGPGVQHVGLHTDDIINTIKTLKHNNVQFVEPPYTYYEEAYFLKKVEELGDSLIEDIKTIKCLGILLDSEDQPPNNDLPEKYLMQMFTKPIFNQDTFFLEIIQRRGAVGFGSGNITALCRAVEKLKSTQVAG